MNNKMQTPVICLIGPTASGKTDLAGELTRHLPFEIISVDSAMIYRGMDIGTAKPDEALLQRVPHHLIDVINPDEHYSAARFCREATQIIENIRSKNKIPLLVGGTMMYFKSLQQGLSLLPESQPQIREAILADAVKYGWPKLHSELLKWDPASAEKIHPNDSQRIQRALEVFQTTGKPLSSFFKQTRQTAQQHYINVLLMPKDRTWLHARIQKRFKAMLTEGLVDETSQLIHQWDLTSEHPSMRTVGYRQVMGYLHNEYSVYDMENKGIAATRQLAKRQLTWMRRWPDGQYFDPEALSHDTNYQQVLEFILKMQDNSFNE